MIKAKFVLTIFFNILISFLPETTIWDIDTLENVINPQQIIWVNEEKVLLVKDEKVFEYFPSLKKLSLIKERNGNEFVGVDSNGDILFCKIEHFTISSPEEFSTKFIVREKEYFFFETIRPIHVDGEEILAVTAFDFLEQHYYNINLNDGSVMETEKPKGRKHELGIRKGLQFKKAYIFSEDKYIVEDIFGNLYIYNKRDITNTIIPTLIPIFKSILTKIPMKDPIPALKL
jgi:hypothetical protein